MKSCTRTAVEQPPGASTALGPTALGTSTATENTRLGDPKTRMDDDPEWTEHNVMVFFRVPARSDETAGEAVLAELARADLPYEYIVSMGPAS